MDDSLGKSAADYLSLGDYKFISYENKIRFFSHRICIIIFSC